MKLALTYSPWLLSARGSLDLEGYRDDPRGLSGSEMSAVRLKEEYEAVGHTVALYSKGKGCLPWEERANDEHDVAISINCPDDLRGMKAKLKVCYVLLNDFSFCKVGFDEHVDLFVSPSLAHREQCLTNDNWRKVEVAPDHPNGRAQWDPSAKPWEVVPLGCDPERYEFFDECEGDRGGHRHRGCSDCDGYGYVPRRKVPGRVIYCSSPDRGLHWLLQEWPAIRKAVPHATLRIFYRTMPWIRNFDAMAYYPPIEPQRARALYIEDALRRLQGHGVELFDSVSRARLEQELAQAEVLAYPCDPANEFTEGFSCSTLEGCAARACPVITDVDALGSIYRDAVPAVTRSSLMGTTWQQAWRRNVIECLTDSDRRNRINDRAEALARSMTWKNTASRLMAAIQERL